MPTYYEILKIQPTAITPEIESAYEVQYHHWRHLVTHHDPTVVNKANQALQALEQIRTTLTDPTKRAAYDAKLNLQGPVGGLADPQARSTAAAPPPPRPGAVAPPGSATASHTPTRTDVWICPQCRAPNPVQSRFCKQCGQTLGVNCPKCNTMVEATNAFCAVCGGNIQQLTEQKQRRSELIDAQQQLAAKRQEVQQAIPDNKEEVKSLRGITVSAIAWIGWLPMGLSIALYEMQDHNNRPEHFIGFLIAGLFGLLLAIIGIIVFKKLTFSAVFVSVITLIILITGNDNYFYEGVFVCGLPVFVLKILWFGRKLTKHGAWVWLLTVAILASGAVGVNMVINGIHGSDNLTTAIFWILFAIVVSIISLSIIALRAWLLSRHLKLEEETAVVTHCSTLKRIDHELQQLTQELALLDVKY